MCETPSLLIVGCGDIGVMLAKQLNHWQVFGLKRNIETLPAFIHPIAADVTDKSSLTPLAKKTFTSAIIILTPGEFSDERYKAIYVQGLQNILDSVKADYYFFVSSTSVYHQQDEQWVDETSPTLPESFSGIRLLQTEQLLSDKPATVVRFAGIYGPGRNRLIEQVIAGKGSPAIYSNRIHSEDCAGFLAHLIERQYQGKVIERCYIGVDNEPVKLSEVKLWLAEQLGFTADHLTAEATTRRGSKRCCNQRMLDSGYELQYPDFRSGYSEVIKTYVARD